MIRIRYDGPGEADANMAADCELLARAVKERCVCLRLYWWHRPTVSLGFMQQPDETLDLEALAGAGGAWVRRPTGGRAVLHDGDLTYCVTFPSACELMGRSIAESYRVIGACLAEGLRRAGIESAAHGRPLDAPRVRREGKLPCFLAPNREELMVGGRKLVGSAQKRTADGVLQHGSIPVTTAFRRLPAFLKLSDPQRDIYRAMLERRCTCVEELRPGLTREALAGYIAEGFESVIGSRQH